MAVGWGLVVVVCFVDVVLGVVGVVLHHGNALVYIVGVVLHHQMVVVLVDYTVAAAGIVAVYQVVAGALDVNMMGQMLDKPVVIVVVVVLRNIVVDKKEMVVLVVVVVHKNALPRTVTEVPVTVVIVVAVDIVGVVHQYMSLVVTVVGVGIL